MNDFGLWFSIGWHHIIDIFGYDHVLYIMAITAMYSFKEWRSVLVLITAFTIGHSVTLAASAFHWFAMKQSLIETLIPITIIITCFYNILNRKQQVQNMRFNYVLALCFGFIHGMAFSYTLRSMLGHEEQIWVPLLSFNLGLESGQILVVLLTLGILSGLTVWLKIKKTAVMTILSSLVLMVSIYLLFNRISEI